MLADHVSTTYVSTGIVILELLEGCYKSVNSKSLNLKFSDAVFKISSVQVQEYVKWRLVCATSVVRTAMKRDARCRQV